MSLRFSSNSEAAASELLENLRHVSLVPPHVMFSACLNHQYWLYCCVVFKSTMILSYSQGENYCRIFMHLLFFCFSNKLTPIALGWTLSYVKEQTADKWGVWVKTWRMELPSLNSLILLVRTHHRSRGTGNYGYIIHSAMLLLHFYSVKYFFKIF